MYAATEGSRQRRLLAAKEVLPELAAIAEGLLGTAVPQDTPLMQASPLLR